MSATVAPAKPASLWEDFIDILYAPTSVFERRREGKFGAALLTLIVVFSAAYFATKPLMQPLMDRAMAQQVVKMQARGMSAEQIEKARPMMEKIGGISANVAGVVGVPLLVFVSALVLWLVGKAFESKASYGQVAMVVTYANVPRLLGLLSGAAILAVRDPATLPPIPQMSVGPALLLGPDASPVLSMLLARLDVFTLWVTVLSAIGLAIVGRIPRGKAFGAAIVTWLVATLVFVAQTWAASA
jgi:hypothetical protein